MSVAASLDRPSRRKNEPGIFPAAYMRSSMSTVSGKKSAPLRAFREAVAVTSTLVSPMLPTTAPLASPARRPVSKPMVLPSSPEISADTEMVSRLCVGAPPEEVSFCGL